MAFLKISICKPSSEDYIYFNEDDTYIFAWGNGKSDKRQWMEERGFQCEGRATQRQITEFFNTLSVYDQAHMINEGWYDFEDTLGTDYTMN